MDSLITLNIRDTSLKRSYYGKRSSEILRISLVILVMTIVFGISSSVSDWFAGTYNYHTRVASYGCIVCHIALILLTWKYPTQVCCMHAPVLVLLMVPSMLWY